VTSLAQNGDGLRADQAGAADDDDFHDLPRVVDNWRPQMVRMRALPGCRGAGGQSARLPGYEFCQDVVSLLVESGHNERIASLSI
jgi:hypothetical protein